jgi:hypothetical protein
MHVARKTIYGTDESATPQSLPKIWLRLTFIGKYGNSLTKKFINKAERSMHEVYSAVENHPSQLFSVMQRQNTCRVNIEAP